MLTNIKSYLTLMQYYSTNHHSTPVTFRQAIMNSEAADGGLYMPERLPILPKAFINNISDMTMKDLSYVISNMLIGEDVSSALLKKIGDKAFSFPLPLIEIEPSVYVMELFHGPTRTVKDIGARFLANLINSLHLADSQPLNVLIATNGNSGNAVANVFHNQPGVNVFALFPKALSRHQVEQLNSYGGNVHTIEVAGHLDNFANMINRAFLDPELENYNFTSANSLNLGHVLPYIMVYFYAIGQLQRQREKGREVYLSIPVGSGGNLLAAYMARNMGLRVDGLIAACNAHSGFPKCLERGIECMRDASVRSLAYAMDTPRTPNMARFMELCKGDLSKLRETVAAATCTDAEITATILDVHTRTGYLLDPHSAVAYASLKKKKPEGATGIFFATSHPQNSAEILHKISGGKIQLTQNKGKNFCTRPEISIPPMYGALKKYLKYYALPELSLNRV